LYNYSVNKLSDEYKGFINRNISLDERFALDGHVKSKFTSFGKSLVEEGYLTTLLHDLLKRYIKANEKVLRRLDYGPVLRDA